MYAHLNCVVVDADAANRQEMAEFLTRNGVTVVGVLPQAEQLGVFLGRNDDVQLAVVNLDPAPAETLARVGPLIRQYPGVHFFTLSKSVDPGVLMDAMHLGVKEFIPLPVNQAKFLAGIERIASIDGPGRHARIVTVVPTIGGCGSTTIACNVAAALARSAKTVLLDLDFVGGSVASSFDLRARYTIADVMDSAERLDEQLLSNALLVHQPTGLSILARPELPEESPRVTQAGFARLMGVLGRVFDYIVIDSVMNVDPVHAAALQGSDLILLVMQLNIPGARNAKSMAGYLRRMGVDPGKLKLVVNRFVKRGQDIEPEEVEQALGLKIEWTVPNDFKNAISAINFGQPAIIRAPGAALSSSLLALQRSVCAQLEGMQQNGNGRFGKLMAAAASR